MAGKNEQQPNNTRQDEVEVLLSGLSMEPVIEELDLQGLLDEMIAEEEAAALAARKAHIESDVDIMLMQDDATKALKGKELKEAARPDEEMELLRQNIYTKTSNLVKQFGVVSMEPVTFKPHAGEGMVTRLMEVKSTPPVPLLAWNNGIQATGVRLVEKWKPIPGNNPDHEVYREHLKLQVEGTNLVTKETVVSTPYKIGIDGGRQFIANDRDNSLADINTLRTVSSYVNYMWRELNPPQRETDGDAFYQENFSEANINPQE